MGIYLVIRTTKWEIPCNDEYSYLTETNIISAHRKIDDAIKRIDNETSLETDKYARYDWKYIELS